MELKIPHAKRYGKKKKKKLKAKLLGPEILFRWVEGF